MDESCVAHVPIASIRRAWLWFHGETVRVSFAFLWSSCKIPFSPSRLSLFFLPCSRLQLPETHTYKYVSKNQGFENIEECPLTPLVVLFVNSTTVWVTAIFARTRINVARSFYGFAFINGLTHVIPSLMDGLAYNPGLVTTWLLFFPGAYLALRLLGGAGRGIAAGIICHIVLMGSMKLAAKGYIAEWALCSVQVLNTILLISF